MSKKISYQDTKFDFLIYSGTGTDTDPTTFDTLFKMFLNSISNDYKIKKWFQEDAEMAEDMLETWLTKAIVKFVDCRINLEDYIDFDDKIFTVALSLTEQVIIVDLMLLVWMEFTTNNITQMNLSIQDGDFKTHAEERNLSGKVAYIDDMRERIYHEMSEYTKKLNPISSWATGG